MKNNETPYNNNLTQHIFKNKKAYHRKLAELPIEEKIKILIELQKIVLNVRSPISENDTRRVWKI
ncbi:MAG: hypothetical protein JXJ04_13215 [Spirochaetales bacterium]|nr:hypothetical protein [Spirochaetales bacterium]